MKADTVQVAARLSDLLRGARGVAELVHGDPELSITSIQYNSREAGAGALFVAIEGFQSDGHAYVRNAVERGASAVVMSQGRMGDFADLRDGHVALLASPDTRAALSRLSSSFYGNPSTRIPVIGITGTNGKTSTTYMLESILSEQGYSPGIIGTVNHRWKGRVVSASNTTPESRDLQELLHIMIRDGVDIAVMEVSSHGLKLRRVDDIGYDAAVFINLTRDHLDLHNTFEDYFAAKKRLFDILDAGAKKERCGFINIDSGYGMEIYTNSSFSYPLKSIGVNHEADFHVAENTIANRIDGLRYVIDRPFSGSAVELKVTGRFHVYNSLAAVAVSSFLNIPLDRILRGLAKVTTIPGRFDRRSSRLGFHVIVDYAHTDDALLNLLASVNDLKQGRVITVFGCGGDRDKSKRPLMGKVASENSDFVIVTSDNPRTEEPGAIIRDIVEGIQLENFEVIPDREQAIQKGIGMAERGDIVVIAGKGHEDYQILGKKKIHFDDREMAEKHIRLLEEVRARGRRGV